MSETTDAAALFVARLREIAADPVPKTGWVWHKPENGYQGYYEVRTTMGLKLFLINHRWGTAFMVACDQTTAETLPMPPSSVNALSLVARTSVLRGR